MAVNLVKGQKVSLVKESPGLRNLRVGLGWDEAEQKRGLFASLFGAKNADIGLHLLRQHERRKRLHPAHRRQPYRRG